MSFTPLLQHSPIIVAHAFAALAALGLGLVQFVAPKGTIPHRAIGWIWVLLMGTVAISSFWIHTIRQFGDFSLIHGLSIYTLIALYFAITSARRHDVRTHKLNMIGLYIGGLIVAGAFTLLPGRIMHDVVFGKN